MKKYFNSFASFLKKNGVIENKNNLIMKLNNNNEIKIFNQILYQELTNQDPRSNYNNGDKEIGNYLNCMEIGKHVKLQVNGEVTLKMC